MRASQRLVVVLLLAAAVVVVLLLLLPLLLLLLLPMPSVDYCTWMGGFRIARKRGQRGHAGSGIRCVTHDLALLHQRAHRRRDLFDARPAG